MPPSSTKYPQVQAVEPAGHPRHAASQPAPTASTGSSPHAVHGMEATLSQIQAALTGMDSQMREHTARLDGFARQQAPLLHSSYPVPDPARANWQRGPRPPGRPPSGYGQARPQGFSSNFSSRPAGPRPSYQPGPQGGQSYSQPAYHPGGMPQFARPPLYSPAPMPYSNAPRSLTQGPGPVAYFRDGVHLRLKALRICLVYARKGYCENQPCHYMHPPFCDKGLPGDVTVEEVDIMFKELMSKRQPAPPPSTPHPRLPQDARAEPPKN